MTRVDQSAELLAMIGRLEDARAVAVRNARLNGSSESDARGLADGRLSYFVAAERLLAGEDPALVSADVKGFRFQGALLQLTGMMTSGTMLGAEVTEDPARRALMRKAVAGIGTDRASRITAAGFLLELGDEEAAAAILDALPVDASPRRHLPDKMIRLIGTARALEIYQGMGDDLPWDWYYRTLADNEPDRDRAAAFLALALEHIESLEPEKRPAKWRVILRDATELGHRDVARQAFKRLQRSVSRNRNAEAGHYIELARAMRAMDMPRADLRRVLVKAERRLSGLENASQIRETSLTIAQLRLDIGDRKAALRVFRSSDRNRQDWVRLIAYASTREMRQAVLRSAEPALLDDDMASLRAYVARSLARETRSASDRAEAERMVRALVRGAPPRDPLEQSYFYDTLVRAAQYLDDAGLMQAALDRSIAEALTSGDHRPLIQAAYRLHRMEGGQALADTR